MLPLPPILLSVGFRDVSASRGFSFIPFPPLPSASEYAYLSYLRSPKLFLPKLTLGHVIAAFSEDNHILSFSAIGKNYRPRMMSSSWITPTKARIKFAKDIAKLTYHTIDVSRMFSDPLYAAFCVMVYGNHHDDIREIMFDLAHLCAPFVKPEDYPVVSKILKIMRGEYTGDKDEVIAAYNKLRPHKPNPYGVIMDAIACFDPKTTNEYHEYLPTDIENVLALKSKYADDFFRRKHIEDVQKIITPHIHIGDILFGAYSEMIIAQEMVTT